MTFSRPPRLSCASEKPTVSIPAKEAPQENQNPDVSTQRGVLLCVKRKREESVNEVVVLEERPSKVRKQDVEQLVFSLGALSVSREQPRTLPQTGRKVFRYLGRKEEILVKESRGDLQQKIAQVKERRRTLQPQKTELNLDQRTKITQVCSQLFRSNTLGYCETRKTISCSQIASFVSKWRYCLW